MNDMLINAVAVVMAGYLQRREVDQRDLVGLIGEVAKALTAAGAQKPSIALPTAPVPPTPFTSPDATITDEYLICLEDGARVKMLRRHLRNRHNMTFEEYCRRWNLPQDYPCVAPSYSRCRRKLASEMGLGRSIQPNPRGKPRKTETGAESPADLEDVLG
ncbi:MucR family transcriptional regulator [Indioceanicola profundi]|uniref:MucR family transcriptional regulator n=1 Tax=Indioceanicola profundi TaxID=2220096 RepID=UPI000E6A9B61|nr:MucR family transcriptional regulator [Indioceanicola profundi]